MTNKELAAALRLCGDTRTVEECRDGCPFYVVPDAAVCVPKMTAACADALENHESHVLALQKEIETLRAQLTTAQSQNEQLRETAALTVKATNTELKFEAFGKTVFLTRKEAEQALKEAKENV